MNIFLGVGIFFIGVFLGGLIVGLCGVSGRADLDIKVFELERKISKLKRIIKTLEEK